jgi:hypothetical protein
MGCERDSMHSLSHENRHSYKATSHALSDRKECASVV